MEIWWEQNISKIKDGWECNVTIIIDYDIIIIRKIDLAGMIL